jgi:hypothetical protein
MTTATSTAEIPGETARGPWIQSPFWDGLWMFSAVWGCILIYISSHTIGWTRVAILLTLGGYLAALYHSWSTTYMVLGSPRMREARAANHVRYRWMPASIVVVAMAVGIYTGATLSFPSTDRFGFEVWPWILYLALFWVGHFWHFGKQDFGVLSLYRSRAGQVDLRSRQIDQVYAFSMMFMIQPIVYLSMVVHSPASQAFYSVIPIEPETIRLFAMGAVLVATILTVAVVGIEISRPTTSIPKLIYYGVMLMHALVLFSLKFGLGYYYLMVYFWSHWLIAVGLVSRINSGHYRALGYRRSTALLRHFVTIGAIILVVGVLTDEFSKFRVFSGRGYKEILASVSPEQGLIVGVFLGLFLSEQLIHYYCDRCLFRMRDPQIRKAIGPLL